jgi:hypothetical protein
MGQLKPGVTYIYERADGITYAREFGSLERTIVGMDFPTREEKEQEHKTEMLWKEILRKGKTNPALQLALDRAIMIYRLSEDDPV